MKHFFYLILFFAIFAGCEKAMFEDELLENESQILLGINNPLEFPPCEIIWGKVSPKYILNGILNWCRYGYFKGGVQFSDFIDFQNILHPKMELKPGGFIKSYCRDFKYTNANVKFTVFAKVAKGNNVIYGFKVLDVSKKMRLLRVVNNNNGTLAVFEITGDGAESICDAYISYLFDRTSSYLPQFP